MGPTREQWTHAFAGSVSDRVRASTLPSNAARCSSVRWVSVASSVSATACISSASVAGAVLAFIEFGRKSARQRGFITNLGGVHRLFANRWYIDAFYKKTFVALALLVARGSYAAETRGFDEGADRIGDGALVTGKAVARGQSGRLQLYIGTAVVVTAALLFLFLKANG